MSDEALFVRNGDRVTPTEYSRGPWVDDATHGGPIAMLVAKLAQRAGSDETGSREADREERGFQLSRLTLELLSGVPLAPLDVRVEVLRAGRRTRLIEVDLSVEGRRIVAARAAQIRVIDLALPASVAAGSLSREADVPPPETLSAERPLGEADGMIRFHSHSVEHRFARGRWADRGRAFSWIRPVVPVFAGEEIDALDRIGAAADFGNGISAPLEWQRSLFINPDLSVHLHRLPEGEWVGLDAGCRIDRKGIGQSVSDLYDLDGHLGTTAQSLLVDLL